MTLTLVQVYPSSIDVRGSTGRRAAPAVTDVAVTVSAGQRCVVVAVHGDIDANTAPTLTRNLESAYVDYPWLMVLDMSDVGAVDLNGFAAIVAARQAFRTRACDLLVRNPSLTFSAMLESTGLNAVAECPTASDA